MIFYVDHTPIVGRNYLIAGSPVGTPEIVVYDAGTPVTVTVVGTATGKITLAAVVATPNAITVDYDWSSLENEMVSRYINEAHSLVLSKLSEKYTLPLSTTPEIVRLIEKKLAAGLLLDKEYSVGGDESEDTRGRRWIKWAESKLNDIVSGALDLLDAGGNSLAQKSAVGIGGWPDETTKDASEDDSGGEIEFRIKKDF